jgi:hypothetical protein
MRRRGSFEELSDEAERERIPLKESDESGSLVARLVAWNDSYRGIISSSGAGRQQPGLLDEIVGLCMFTSAAAGSSDMDRSEFVATRRSATHLIRK